MIVQDKFGSYDRYTLSNGDMEVSVITYGATLTSVKYKGIERILNYATAEEYENGSYFIGASVGRYGNRIKGSSFELDGKKYDLQANEGKNMLHGGFDGFDKKVWKAEVIKNEGEFVRFTYVSDDGEAGFPGMLEASVVFSLKKDALVIEFFGNADKLTHFAPTVHPYFNLDGSEDVRKAKLQISDAGHLEVDSELIPTGTVLPCEGDFDFKSMRTIDVDLDDCFVTPLEYSCTLEMGSTQMEVWSTFPAVQIYTGGSLGEPFGVNRGIAIEPEFYPDSPNNESFPSTVLEPGKEFYATARYHFFEL